jgi:hypothetical protein
MAALPGWKRAIGERLDALIVKTLPDVKKAVKWNSPMYGTTENGYFLGIHACAKYLKIAFFMGAKLDPLPPVESKQPDVRYLHIFENEILDEAQFCNWVREASQLPGWLKC